MDFLAEKVIEALKKTEMAESWIRDKKHAFEGQDRLAVLRSLSNLDGNNLKAVATELGVEVKDLQATFRVLNRI